ncbi:MAG: DegV family EDD domain-containing protein [Gammaproteobacteria bacterium]|nr:DegV family EDD domain-containing protein [Gammaproteobacteria bacterium]
MSSPVTTHLNGDSFSQAFISGIHRVIDEQDFLNRINVFPVADGDTGTNLSLSLGATLPLLTRTDDQHLGTLLAAVADALLDSSRGNSGAIVAQFFQGVSDSAGEISRFTTYTFSKAVTLGSEYAHDALSEPREGTILSVISAFADSVKRQSIECNEEDFRVVIERAVERVEKALAETPNQLDVLRKAGVVDAGAKGFATMVSGMAEYIRHGRVAPKPDLSALFSEELSFATSAEGADSSFRFCTECIVTGADIDRRKMRESLDQIGDSLVLAGTKRKAKIHIHVDEPEQVFELARRYGDLSAEKADDIHRQHVSSHNDARRFAVITDSAADIPDDDMERLDIHMVPLRIQFGEHGYLDKVSISTEEFFHELATNPYHPTTSQPAPGDFRRQFQFLASHFSDVISINVTARVSGTFHAATAAAARVNAPGIIHVVDSHNASLGQGLLAIFAAECSKAGLSADNTLAKLEQITAKTRAFAIVSDLRYAVKGGRIPGYIKTIADLLRLTPVIRTTSDGRIGTAGFLLGRRKRLQKFARYIATRVSDDGPLTVLIGHAICPQDATLLEHLLRDELNDIHRLSITELGTAFGVHGGPATLVVATQPSRELPENVV